MSLRNKVTLIGHTGKEVEVFNFENGTKKATLPIFTTVANCLTSGFIAKANPLRDQPIAKFLPKRFLFRDLKT